MLPKLLAFDLDGTLLATDKVLTEANRRALEDMVAHGAIVAIASGRIGGSMARYSSMLDVDVALLTLNGAAVYTSARDPSSMIYSAYVPTEFSDHLIAYAADKDFVTNFYRDGKLYAERRDETKRWADLYVAQTASEYNFVDSLSLFAGTAPHKIIFVGDPDRLDKEEKTFRERWGEQLYIVRTWEYYLEFLNRDATKARGIAALADAFGVELSEVAAFGDSANDIPMLEVAGMGIAMQNARDNVKAVADHVCEWTNDQDGVAREWERIKRASGG